MIAYLPSFRYIAGWGLTQAEAMRAAEEGGHRVHMGLCAEQCGVSG